MTAIELARQFLDSHGRDIDMARFRYHFAGGARDDVVAALAGYQHADGGFHGLEVDIAAPHSNPFATSLALQICLAAGIPGSHPLLQRTVAYLEATQGEEDGGWRFEPDIYDYPLAPWFQGWQFPALNPSCVLAGLLRGLGLGSEQLHTRVASLFHQLARVEDLAGDEFYNLQPYFYYFTWDEQHPDAEHYLPGVLAWLIRKAPIESGLESTHFFEYVRTPHTYTGRNLPGDLLQLRLDGLAAEQQSDGGWPTPYNPAWRPWVTVQSLLVLRAFGRI